MSIFKKRSYYAATVAWMLVLAPAFSHAADAADPLPSWNDGATKTSIEDFVARVTTEGSDQFVPQEARIATFDNDGTLWAEKPLYFQFVFALDRIKVLAPQHPEWTTKEPFASILKGDIKGALSGGEPALLAIVAATVDGLTTEDYTVIVKDWLETDKHPTSHRLYPDMAYQPMKELLTYLRENGFKTFIVSGGGVEFMRAFAEKVYGIPPEQVIGTSGKLHFEMRADVPVLLKLPELGFYNDGPTKPVAIQTTIGRRPIAAFGNSDGDLQMLQWTCGTTGMHYCLYVHHTDAQREWAYDRKSDVGQLDKGLDVAASQGWTVVDMKNDWKTIFTEAEK
jgi:phosphoglycolate phosphatase-like HAD superfamily hydrolase